MKWIQIGDVHLGTSFSHASYNGQIAMRRRYELKETLFRVLQVCRDENIDLLLVAGDLFEMQSAVMSDYNDVLQQFMRCDGTEIVICAGNHDPIYDEHAPWKVLQWPPNVHIVATKMTIVKLEHLQVAVHSFSWWKGQMARQEMPALLPLVPNYRNFLMLHGDVTTQSVYLPLDARWLEQRGFDYIALGHIHKPTAITPTIRYAGVLEPLDFKETGEHGYILGEFVEAMPKISFVPFAKRAFVQIQYEVTPEQSGQDILTGIQNLLKQEQPDHLFRLKLIGYRNTNVNIKESLPLWLSLLEEMVFYVEMEDQTETNWNLDEIYQEHQSDLLGAYIGQLRQMAEANPEDSIIKEALDWGVQILLKDF